MLLLQRNAGRKLETPPCRRQSGKRQGGRLCHSAFTKLGAGRLSLQVKHTSSELCLNGHLILER